MTTLFKKLLVAGATLAVSAFALVSFGQTSSVSATSCVAGTKYTDFKGSISGRDTLTIQTANGGKLCNDVNVNFASYIAPANYNGKGFKNNPTAIPQSQYYVKTVTLKKGTTGKTTVTVQVPDDCTNYQIDAYIGKIQTSITTSEGLVGTNAIKGAGRLFQKTKNDCSVPQVKACNTDTGVIEMVDKGKENVAPHTTNLDKCEKTEVCDTKTGDVVTVTKEEAKDARYAAADSDKCKDTPEEIPSTGPTEIISGIAGIGSVAGASSMYIRSRRALRR